jgi:hypothetical protein
MRLVKALCAGVLGMPGSVSLIPYNHRSPDEEWVSRVLENDVEVGPWLTTAWCMLNS